MSGFGLDAQTRALLDRLAADPLPDIKAMPPDEMRASHATFFASVGMASDPSIAAAEDRVVPGAGVDVPVRIYRPLAEPDGPLPLLVYLHGGGMVAGSVESYDAICRLLSARAGAIVVSVDYRLAPEHKFPAAVDDAFAATKWASANAAELGADPTRVAVGGDSAGGNLAAVVAQLAHAYGGPRLVFQLLVYPAVGTYGHSHSMAEFATGYLFEREEYDWLYAQYLTDRRQAHDPRVSPVLADDLSGLPPAFVVTAGFDILRDDGEAYAERLRQAGVPVEQRRYEHTVHAFLSMAGVLDAGRAAIDECAAKLREAFARAAVFENDHVRIARSGPATDRPTVAVDLATGAIRYEADGVREPAIATELRVELKAAPEHGVEEALDAVRVDPGRYRIELDNDRVRVVRLRFGPGERGSMVSHPPRVLVTMTDVAVRLELADGTRDERSAPAGVAGWLEAETLRTENIGDEPLEVVLVEPKPVGEGG